MPIDIHPTSIIDPLAQMADGVEIGPWCRIEGQVTIGAGTRLIANVHLVGPLTIGWGNTIYPFTCLGMAPQDRKYDPKRPGAGLVIGDENIFREGVTIHRATGDHPTTIGHRNYFMGNSHLGHDCVVGNDAMLANGAFMGGHAVLGDQAVLGGTSGVHQFCRVGRLALLSGLAGASSDITPFAIIYNTRELGGVNLIGLRRAGYRDHIAAVKRAYEILFEEGRSNASAVGQIEQELGEDPLCMELAAFVKSSKRGLTNYARSRVNQGLTQSK